MIGLTQRFSEQLSANAGFGYSRGSLGGAVNVMASLGDLSFGAEVGALSARVAAADYNCVMPRLLPKSAPTAAKGGVPGAAPVVSVIGTCWLPRQHHPEDGRMMDWNAHRNQLMAGVGELGKLSPGTVDGYLTASGAGQETGHLDAKTRQLISLAVAVTTRCDGCISVHAAEAVKEGASKAEIAEALGVAVAMNTGAALVYSTRVLAAVDQAGGA